MTGANNIQDPAHLFPIFPYIVDEQQRLAVPDYVKAAEAHAKICIREEIIQGIEWGGDQPYPMCYLRFLDGTAYCFSAMQATLILMGVLKYHKIKPEERTELEELMKRRVPIAERAYNPQLLERPTRKKQRIMDPEKKWEKRSAAHKEVAGLDLSHLEVNVDEIDFDFD